MKQPETPWWVRPSIILPLIAVVVLITLLVAPRSTSDDRESRLTTYSADPGGAQLLYELTDRLAWDVERSQSRELDTSLNTVHVVLAPVVPLRASEVNALLAHVRRGGAALVAAQWGAMSIRDSLGLRTAGGGYVDSTAVDTSVCPPQRGFLQGFWTRDFLLSAFRTDSSPHARIDTLVRVGRLKRDSLHPSVVGIELGAGRLVLLADADMLRNDALRVCRHGFDVATVRALEYLRAGGPVPRTRIVFDEYHQGFGAPPGSLNAILAEFAETSSGRTFYQLLLAGVVLLIASAPRLVPPRDVQRMERRSPLEHVDALARAYATVGASRTATRRLVHGVRRRVERTSVARRASSSDEHFLQRVGELHPTQAEAVALVNRALNEDIDKPTLARVIQAVAQIEETLTRT